MNPDTRMTISLLLSLAVSAPNLRMAAMGEADIVSVGLRYTLGFVVIFLAVGAIGTVFNQYLVAVDARNAQTAPAEATSARTERHAAADQTDGASGHLDSSTAERP